MEYWINPNVLAFCGFWAVLALLAGLELLIPSSGRQPERDRRWPTNFAFGGINIGLLPLAPVSTVWAAQWAHDNGFGLLNIVEPGLWIAVIATGAVRSFGGYALHCAMHKLPLLWRIHRVHHFDTFVDVSTTLRSHPLEIGVMLSTMVPLSIVFGLSPGALAAYEIMEAIIVLFSHANVRLPETPDRLLRLFVVTPRMHHLHHSSHPPETDSNYGAMFSIWDRLFGTYVHAPAHGPDLHVGLEEVRDRRAWDLWWQIKSPVLRL